MKTQVEKLPHSRVALEIEVEPERVEAALDQAYRRIVRRVDIPGFRRGRAPRAIVERRYGRESLLQEALDDLLPAVFSQAIEETGLQPVGTPTFDVEDEEKGGPLLLKAEVDVKPEVQLGEYRGIKAEKLIEEITDQHVDDVIEGYRQHLTRLVEPEDRDVAEEGDFAVIDFEGFIDGEPFAGGAAKGYTLELGSGAFIPGFEDQVVGMQVGETKELTVTFPEEGYPEHLQGREATFKVTLSELKVKQVPPVDDELAKEAGEADTLEEWRASIRKRLEERAMDEATRRFRDELARAAVARAELEVPKTFVDIELKAALEEMAFEFARQGISFDDYLQHTGQTVTEVLDGLRSWAEAKASMTLVLEAIAEKENLEPTEEEIEAEKETIFSGVDGPEPEDGEARERLVAMLRMRKAVEFLEEHAAMTERTVSAEELAAALGESEEEEDLQVGGDPEDEGEADGESEASSEGGEGDDGAEEPERAGR